MRKLFWMILGGAAMLAAPAAAETYNYGGPICLQQWEWGGSIRIECNYTSWDRCRAASVGYPAMCVENPYFPRTQPKLANRLRADRRH